MAKFSSQLSEIGLFGPQIDFLEPKNIFFLRQKGFKSTSDHIFHDIDQKNVPSSEFPSMNRPQMVKFSSQLSEIGLFGPQIDFLEPQNIFFCCLKCFKSAFSQISHDTYQKNGTSSEFLSLNGPQMAQFSSHPTKLGLFDPKSSFQSPKTHFSDTQNVTNMTVATFPMTQSMKMDNQVSSTA